MKTFQVEYKEYTANHIGTTSYTGDCTENDVIDFFGLNEPDIEWFNITEIK